jgi:putative addiction module component (TIGR02574 family)
MSATELIEKMRPMATEEKRAFLEQVWTEFGEELGWAEPELTPEQKSELDRRLADFAKNPRAGNPLEQVKAEMLQRFGWQ